MSIINCNKAAELAIFYIPHANQELKIVIYGNEKHQLMQLTLRESHNIKLY